MSIVVLNKSFIAVVNCSPENGSAVAAANSCPEKYNSVAVESCCREMDSFVIVNICCPEKDSFVAARIFFPETGRLPHIFTVGVDGCLEPEVCSSGFSAMRLMANCS